MEIAAVLAPYANQNLVLFSSYTSTMSAETLWRRLQSTLLSLGFAEGNGYTAIDGASNPEVRKALWSISQERTYPQVFVHRGSSVDYIGNGEAVIDICERQMQPLGLLPVTGQILAATELGRVNDGFNGMLQILSDDDVRSIIGMTRTEFFQLKAWKQRQLKQAAGFTDTNTPNLGQYNSRVQRAARANYANRASRRPQPAPSTTSSPAPVAGATMAQPVSPGSAEAGSPVVVMGQMLE